MVILAGLIQILGVLAAIAYLPLAGAAPGALRSVFKSLPLAAFALAAWLYGADPYLVSALFLCSLGDFALSRTGRAAFLYGLAAFSLAHVLYVLAFLGVSGMAPWDSFAIAPLPALALILLALSSEIWLLPHAGPMAWPVRGYVVLIAAMGLAALTLPAGFAVVQLGAGLFIASDLLLSVRLFRMHDGHRAGLAVSWLLWALYVAGQLLIVRGFAAP